MSKLTKLKMTLGPDGVKQVVGSSTSDAAVMLLREQTPFHVVRRCATSH